MDNTINQTENVDSTMDKGEGDPVLNKIALFLQRLKSRRDGFHMHFDRAGGQVQQAAQTLAQKAQQEGQA